MPYNTKVKGYNSLQKIVVFKVSQDKMKLETAITLKKLKLTFLK